MYTLLPALLEDNCTIIYILRPISRTVQKCVYMYTLLPALLEDNCTILYILRPISRKDDERNETRERDEEEL